MNPLALLGKFIILPFVLISLSGFVITGKKGTPHPLDDPEITLEISSVIKDEKGNYFASEASREFAKDLRAYFLEKYQGEGISKKTVIEEYFPEVCFFPGTRLLKYRPNIKTPGQKTISLLFVVSGNPLDNPWDFEVRGCPHDFLRFRAENQGNPEVEKKFQECLQKNVDLVLERNFCVARIVIDYGMFE